MATEYYALQKLRASALQNLVDDHLRVAKQGNTQRTSNATPTADPELTLTFKAGFTYITRFVLFSSSPTAADIAFRLQFPSGATTPFGGLRLVNSATVTAGSVDANSSGSATSGTTDIGAAGVGGSDLISYLEACVVMGFDDGAVTLLWAQGTLNASATTLYAGSFMTATRIR